MAFFDPFLSLFASRYANNLNLTSGKKLLGSHYSKSNFAEKRHLLVKNAIS